MRAHLQRVTTAQVQVDSQPIGRIDHGLLILFCAMQGDGEPEIDYLVRKISALRIFRDDVGKMNKSLRDTGGSALIVSQFTLAAETASGNRPGFSTAATPLEGEALYHCFCDKMRAAGLPVATGTFGADMKVSLTNDGPVTIWIDTQERQRRTSQT